MRAFFFFLIMVGVVGCQHRPVEEMLLADVAVRAAQKARADALSPDTFRKAENFFLRARRDYDEGYFDSCKKFATEARLLAEQAEFQALLKQTQLNAQGIGDDYDSPGQWEGDY